jgi:hypothetical protein
MQKLTLPLWIIVAFFWLILLPVTFVTLYSAIELQNAARSTPGVNSRLAMLDTIALVRKLDLQKVPTYKLEEEFRNAKNARYQRRDEVRIAAIEILVANDKPDARTICNVPDETSLNCTSQLEGSGASCLKDWRVIQKCYDEALTFEGKASSEDKRSFKALRDLMKTAGLQTVLHNAAAERAAAALKLEKDPLFPVANALRQPLTKDLLQMVFVIPQGVVVACFTSLMAVLGAGVASLLKFRRRKASIRGNDALKSFLVAPLIGGLTGFMVYFVISAGTAVLVEPAPATSSQPISNLSAPALASLGIFAGLAAEQAIIWLQQKASAFFRTDRTVAESGEQSPKNQNDPAKT